MPSNKIKLYVKKLSESSGRLFKANSVKAMLAIFVYNQMIKECTCTDLKIISENKIMKTVSFFYGILGEMTMIKS